MAKRGQTGGVPKGTSGASTSKADLAAQKRAQPRLIREYKTRAEREAVIQRYIILGTAIAIGIALVILVGALLVDQLVVPGQTTAVVNGTNITVGEFQRRVRFERALINNQLRQTVLTAQQLGMDGATIQNLLLSQPPYSTWLNEVSVPDQLGNRVLNDMIEDELIRQRAAELGISVTQDDIQKQINEFFGYDPEAAAAEPTPTTEPTLTPTPFVSPTPTNTPTPTQTPEFTPTATFTPFPSATPTSTPDATQRAEEFNTLRNDFFGSLRRDAGLSDADLNKYFEDRALRAALHDQVTADQAHTAPFVNLRQIVVANQDQAQQILEALQAGESFTSLASATSTDASSSQGGELGWLQESTLETQYGAAFSEAISGAEIDALVGPVEVTNGYTVAQVRGREDRDLTDTEYEAARDAAFNTYLEELRASQNPNIQINDLWLDNIPDRPVFVFPSLA